MNIALLGGSFDPVHNGHLTVAYYVAEHTNTDEVWFMLSPRNPLKQDKKQTSDQERMEMLRLATAGRKKFKVCDIELTLPKPNYTVNTLAELRKRHPEHTFSLIIGEDNLTIFTQWKEFEHILDQHTLLVYPRNGYSSPLSHPHIVRMEAMTADVSSTQIRRMLRQGENPYTLMPSDVAAYIKKEKLYL